jgi:hypothetical protein
MTLHMSTFSIELHNSIESFLRQGTGSRDGPHIDLGKRVRRGGILLTLGW